MPPGYGFRGAGTNFWLDGEVRKVSSRCFTNQAQVKGASRIGDVVRLADVHIRSELRPLKSTITGLSSLNAAVESRISELLEAGLTALKACETAEAALQVRGQFMKECEPLRGNYAALWRRADAESHKILYAMQKKENPSKGD